jgi:hypothetical protein
MQRSQTLRQVTFCCPAFLLHPSIRLGRFALFCQAGEQPHFFFRFVVFFASRNSERLVLHSSLDYPYHFLHWLLWSAVLIHRCAVAINILILIYPLSPDLQPATARNVVR